MSRRAREPRTDWTGWAPPSPIVRDLRRYMRRHRRSILAAYVALGAAFTYGLWDAQRSRQESCRAGNDLRRIVSGILSRSENTLPKFIDEGTLTREQVERALEESRRSRRELAPRDCSAA